ncbi:MAG: cupin domain-containing protein [Armatimonadota bacterium]|nr:cupin domain-containing protein [Armatimonadota bacterium]
MGKYADVELAGPQRARALAAIEEQMQAWGLTMPEVEPLPLDFGLKRFDEVGETEFWVANETEHGYCGKFLFLFDGQTCPQHHHEVKHETFYVLKGRIRMCLDDGERIMEQGDVLAMAPGTGHCFTGLGPALVLEVSMPSVRRDSFFEDDDIGDDGVI